MRKWLLVLLLVVCTPSAVMAALSPDDFAYGFTIDVPTGTPVAAMSLPEQVYQDAYRRDLGDLRVFNAVGEPVPHMIRFAQSRSLDSPWRSLAFFPLAEPAIPDAGAYRVHVQTGPDGAIVSVDPQLSPLPTSKVSAYLIDLSQLRRSLAQLQLEWIAVETNVMTTVSVDASDDLVTWTTLQKEAAISDIRYGGHRLLRNIVALKRSSKQYLRLRQLGSGPTITLLGVKGRIGPQGRFAIRAVQKIVGQPVPESPGVFEYVTSGSFPVDRINLIFDQANSMAEARMESRSDGHSPWFRRAEGLFYRIDINAATLTSDPHTVPLTTDRHWRLTVDASDSTIGNAIPQLEVGYRPHDLFFIARGTGPFTLAFGSSRVEPLQINVAALFDGIGRQQVNALERWVVPERSPIILGGPQRLLLSPQPLPTRRILLWSILLAGVLVVAAMAWRLARRMTA